MVAIFFVLRTDCQWNALNATGICSSSSAHRRFQEWTKAGVFARLWELGLHQYDGLKGIVLSLAAQPLRDRAISRNGAHARSGRPPTLTQWDGISRNSSRPSTFKRAREDLIRTWTSTTAEQQSVRAVAKGWVTGSISYGISENQAVWIF
jgi:transposase